MASDAEEKKSNVLDEPIPGPPKRGPDHVWEVDYERPINLALQIQRYFMALIREPVYWIRENVVEANRGPKYYWYHRKYPRALPIDECYLDDIPCQFEADLEYKRNWLVDKKLLRILQMRRDNCDFWWRTRKPNNQTIEPCQDIIDTYKREETNYFIKYGNLAVGTGVIHAYNKQKHRMIVDRRRAQMERDGTLPERRPEQS